LKNKSLLFIIFAGLLISASAFASTTNCPIGSYGAYLGSGFTCTNGNLTFSTFGYTTNGSSTGLAVAANSVTVTPQTASGNEGFQFQTGFSVGSSGGVSNTQESQISFTITGAAITDLHLFFNGAATGTGATSVVETYCMNGAIAGCVGGNTGSISVTNPPAKFNDSVLFFAPVTSVSVSKDVRASSGVNGTASVSQMVNTFSNSNSIFAIEAPEPLSFVLLGSGLLGLGLLRKKIVKR
jgi:hypothetical protein